MEQMKIDDNLDLLCWDKRSALSIEEFFSERGKHLGWESTELSFSVISKMTKSKVREIDDCVLNREAVNTCGE